MILFTTYIWRFKQLTSYAIYKPRRLRAVVRENLGFFPKFGKCDLTDFDETLHIQSTLRINNFPAIIDFLA